MDIKKFIFPLPKKKLPFPNPISYSKSTPLALYHNFINHI